MNEASPVAGRVGLFPLSVEPTDIEVFPGFGEAGASAKLHNDFPDCLVSNVSPGAWKSQRVFSCRPSRSLQWSLNWVHSAAARHACKRGLLEAGSQSPVMASRDSATHAEFAVICSPQVSQAFSSVRQKRQNSPLKKLGVHIRAVSKYKSLSD